MSHIRQKLEIWLYIKKRILKSIFSILHYCLYESSQDFQIFGKKNPCMYLFGSMDHIYKFKQLLLTVRSTFFYKLYIKVKELNLKPIQIMSLDSKMNPVKSKRKQSNPKIILVTMKILKSNSVILKLIIGKVNLKIYLKLQNQESGHTFY